MFYYLLANSIGTLQPDTKMAYGLIDVYNSANFFNAFNFYTGSDPTHGWVNYQSQSAAASQGLINNNNGQIYLGVDYSTINPAAPGRNSVRVTSNKAYTHGLFIADIAHMYVSLLHQIWVALTDGTTKAW
jgi:hypothetical protein